MMSRQLAAGVLQPVLQLVDAPRPVLAATSPPPRYRMTLSDGAHLQPAVLTTSLNGLVTGGELRRGTVIRVLEYISGVIQKQRFILVIQLEILHAEFALIGNPTIYEDNATQHFDVCCSGGLGSNEPCFMPGAQQVVSDSSCLPSHGHGLLDSSSTTSVEPAMNSLPFGECLSSVTARSAIDAKMQQLSLKDHQNERFALNATGYAFVPSGNTSGNAMPPSNFHSTPTYMDKFHIATNESPLRITPINALNPYRARWRIKARVTAKTDLRHFTNSRGPGKVFWFDLLDAEGGEVRATCFNSQAEQYFDLIEVDKVYLISERSLRPAQKKFNSLNNDYEILLDHRTSIEICCGVETSFIMQQYNFRQISEIENMEIGAFVDLVGIVMAVGPSAMLMRKDGTRAQKRPVQLKDMSGRSVEIVFWGKFGDAEGHQLQLLSDSGSNPVLAVKGGRISDFSGRSVVTISSTRLKVNPDLPVVEGLKQWYMAGGKTAPCVSLSQDTSSVNSIYVQKTISQIKDENLGRSDKPDFITVRAVILNVLTDKFCYPACTLEFNGKRCNKKVTRNDNWAWYCGRCNQSFENCEYRYLLTCQIKDHTGTTVAIAFQEAGEAIVGYTAHELFTIRNVHQDEARFRKIMDAVLGREYLFKLRTKEETFNTEQPVKFNIVSVDKLDASDMSHRLLEEIDNLLKDFSHSTLQGASSYHSNVGYGLYHGLGSASPFCRQ
ncbi:hypothetical protein HU200_053325 [Digitaria exilis]|uniref:Replication protein A subunit n=1 Tax=Digitaria exilis TaxID=1010633 RepID=A0A835AHU6_9POAL|nr:hypothetical protein HU200_053325 [Digitaria exilis]